MRVLVVKSELQHDDIIQYAIDSIKITDATPNRTPAVSISLVSVDDSHMNIYNSLIPQRNNRIIP